MVDFEQLRDARPEFWQRAADGWRAEATHAAHCADTIRARGVGPVTQDWVDSVGRSAAANLTSLGDAFECAATEMRGAVMVLDGLAESIGMAQSTLQGGIDDAARSGLVVDAVGRVSRPPDTVATPGDDEVIPRVQRMVDEALREATQADELAARAMARIRNGTTVTDPKQAANLDQAADSQDQMVMLAGVAPPRGNPALAGQWWQSLSQPQRDAYERAEPVVIAGLDGVPEAERAKMHLGEDGIDRARFVGYALDHATDPGLDVFQNNCAQFVSTSLNAAGRLQQVPPTDRAAGSAVDPWYHGGYLPWKLDHSDSWAVAQDLHDHLVRTGSHSVKMSEVQPGDIMFFRTPTGEVKHAAVVTGVSPDGDIKYSQHTDDARSSSLDGRGLYQRYHSNETVLDPIRVGDKRAG